jgi:hypothetical protein
MCGNQSSANTAFNLHELVAGLAPVLVFLIPLSLLLDFIDVKTVFHLLTCFL